VSFHAYVQARHGDAVVSACRRHGCRLDLEGVGNPITVLDCDKLTRSGQRAAMCDFIAFLGEAPHVIPVEMKSKSWRASEVAAQLTGGASLADRLLGNHPCAGFHPLLVYEAASHTAQLKILNMHKVRFRGQEFPITRLRCGASLRDKLKAGE